MFSLQSSRVFISYARADGEEFATQLRQRLEREEPEITLWQDRARLEGGKDWWNQILDALDHVQFMVLIMTPASQQSAMVRKEWRAARERGVCIYPVVASPDLDFGALPRWMSKAHFYHLDKEWETFTNYLKSPCRASRVPFMADDLPEDYTDRPQILAALRAVLLDGENPAPGTVVLHGPGGFGKTTLAQVVCHDDDILTAYDAGVLWATLGERPNILNELIKLYAALTDERPAFVDIEDAASHVARKLGENNCLLVIDDVWNEVHLRPFLRGGPGCARLITTRDGRVAAETHNPVEVYEMTSAEAVNMLTARLDQPPIVRQPFQQLAHRLGEWPLMLDLAGAMLRQRVLKGDTPLGAVQYLNKALDKRGATAFDRTNAGERNQAIARSLAVSLDQLEPAERQRHVELAIFPDDVAVPLSALQALWGLDDFDAEETVERLSDLSLLRYDLNAKTIRLHDVVRRFLADQLADPPAVHARLIDAWGDLHQLSDLYAWRYIAHHLSEAKRNDQLCALLWDYSWLQAKLNATDANALVLDCQYFVENAALQRLGRTLRHAAHVLTQDHSQLNGQLLGRLLDIPIPEIQNLLSQAVEFQHTPYLLPLAASLRESEALLRTLVGHTNTVRRVAITPDGRLAISASNDETLRVWDVNSGILLRTLVGHTSSVNGIAVSSDGKITISASADETLRVWDVMDGTCLRKLEGHTSAVNDVALTLDGQRAISASSDSTLKVWNVTSGQEIATFIGHEQSVRSVAITPDGLFAVSASNDRTLKVWDIAARRELHTLSGHTGWVNSVAVTSDGRLAISASEDRTLKVWDVARGELLLTITGHERPVNAAMPTPQGEMAISASDDRTLKVWNVADGHLKYTLRGHAGEINSVALFSSRNLAISGAEDRTVKLWDLTMGGREILTASEGHAGKVTAVAITPDQRVALSASEDRTVKVWDLDTRIGAVLRTLVGHTDQVNKILVEPAGKRAISASNDRTLKVWNLENGELMQTLVGHTGWVNDVAITFDGRLLVSASNDRTLKVWETTNGKVIWTLADHTDWVTNVAITADGRQAISLSRDKTLKLWDLADKGRLVQTFEGHTGIFNCVVTLADGRLAVLVASDKILKIWDVAYDTLLRTLEDHTSDVNNAVLTPGGLLTISVSNDQTLKVWNLSDGHCVATFFTNEALHACAVAPDGVTIVAGGASGRLHFLRFVEK